MTRNPPMHGPTSTAWGLRCFSCSRENRCTRGRPVKNHRTPDEAHPASGVGRQTVPAELDGLYRKMVAKSPSARQQSMGELLKELENVLRTLGVTTPNDLFDGREDNVGIDIPPNRNPEGNRSGRC